MSWRDEWQQAQFRGATFQVHEHAAKGGRRVASHEYPQRDKPYTEDMGRQQRQFSIQAVVIGDDYRTQRDRLIEALEMPGAGLLVHPWLGRLQVMIASYSVTESTAKGGQATLSLQCVESGNEAAPQSTLDTSTVVRDQSDALNRLMIGEFKHQFQVQGQRESVRLNAVQRLSSLSDRLNMTAGDLQSMMASPRQLAQAVVNATAALVTEVTTAQQALARTIKKPVRWPLGHSEVNRRNATNGFQLDTLANVAAITAVAQSISTTSFQSQIAASQALIALTDAIDQQMKATGPGDVPLPDALYLALYDLQAFVSADIQTRGLLLPRIEHITLAQTLPSLVVVYRQYGDIRHDRDFVMRNQLRRPGFVPAGQPMEVLAT